MDKIFSPIKERIIKYIDLQGISRENFYKKTSISASNFKGTGAKSELGGDKIAKILTEYSDINPDWLLTGSGFMIKNNTGNVANGNGIIQQSPNSKIHQIIAKDEAIIADQKKEIQALKKRIKELETDKEQLTTEKNTLYDILKNIKK